MRKIMVAAMSRDGYIASPEKQFSEWISEADEEHFAKIKRWKRLYVMGKNTFEEQAGNMIHRPSLLRVVMTQNPLEHENRSISGQLEFTNESPEEIVRRFEAARRRTMLILGGSMVYEAFLNDGLVDDIYLTVEPEELGSGVPLLRSGRNLVDVLDNPNPQRITDINAKGTQLWHYNLAA